MSDDERDPLLDLEPRTRFTDRAADYVRFRPDYPDAAWDGVLEGLGPPAALRIADVGAGTGISSRQLGDRGATVIAIEPNQAMRDAATPHPRVTWRDGSAEATGLEAGGVDAVVCAQAFHWFRQDQAIGEFHRVLRPAGRLALVWNCRDREDPLTRGFIDAIHAVNGEHPVERIPFDPRVVEASGTFAPAHLSTIPHGQRLDREGLLGRALSASYVPRDGERWAELSRLLVTLFDRHVGSEGWVTLRYRTEVWTADRR